MVGGDDFNNNNNKSWVSSNKSFKNQFHLKQTLDSFSSSPINEIIILRIKLISTELNTTSLFKVDRDSTVKELLYQILKKKRLSINDGFGLYLVPNNRVDFGMWLDDSKPLYLYELFDQDILECKKKVGTDFINQFHIKVVFPEQMKSKTIQVESKMLVKDAVALINTKMDIQTQIPNQDINNYGLYSLNTDSSSNTTCMSGGTSILMKDNELLSAYSYGGNMNIMEFRKKEIVIISLNSIPSSLSTAPPYPKFTLSNTITLSIQIKSSIHEIISEIKDWLELNFKIEITSTYKLLLLQSKHLKLWLIDSKSLDSYNIKKNDLLYLFPKVMDEINLNLGIGLKITFSACTSAMDISSSNSNNKLITKTLPGELLILKIENVVLLNIANSKPLFGDIYMTNFQLIFYTKESNKEYNIHLGVISKIEKVSNKSNHSFCFLDLHCKDFRFVRFLFKSKDISRKKLYQTLKQQCFPGIQTKLFSFYNKEVFYYPDTKNLIDGWSIYNAEKEYKRLGIRNGSGWRISNTNENYQKCESYPKLLVVPETITDEQLNDVFIFRSKGRIPVLSWRHPTNGTTITRCSQPLVGLTGSRCIDDELLIKQISSPDRLSNLIHSNSTFSLSNLATTATSSSTTTNIIQNKRQSYYSNSFSNLETSNAINGENSSNASNKAILNLFDARPKVNAMSNKAFMGAGFEGSTFYSCCNIDFLNIGNIHVMRESLEKLKATCIESLGGIQEYIPLKNNSVNSNSNSNNSNNEEAILTTSTSNDDLSNLINEYSISDIIDNNEGYIGNNAKWFQGIESSGWFDHIILIMKGAIKVVESVHKLGQSCLLHCSDGWDRTSQLASISMILLDPYYRTLEGFIILIEKEWLSIGHKFNDRVGQGDTKHSDERSPVFLQFIECVYHLQVQFKNYFQFNELVLIEILIALYSFRFGTFLFNNEREREINKCKEQTVSLWSLILSNPNNQYINQNYIKMDKVLIPSLAIPYYALWKDYYLKNLLPS